MRRLKKKLKSQDGASLILALLVFLLCVMVASSVLAAAASNAGKAKSSQVEQQKYLTLSSALRLVCGELEKVEYIGKYDVYEWPDSEGKECIHYKQSNGEFKMQDGITTPTFELINVLSLGDVLGVEMDKVFSKSFLDDTGGAKTGYTALYQDEAAQKAAPVFLTVELPPGDLGGYPDGSVPEKYKYTISRKVTIQIKFNHKTRDMEVTAWLGDKADKPNDGSDGMIAYLGMAGSLTVPKVPSLRMEADLPDPSSNLIGIEEQMATWKLDTMRMTSLSGED